MEKSTQSWHTTLSQAITDPKQLGKLLALSPEKLPFSESAHQAFKLRVPLPFIKRMQKGDPNDPLLLQVLPHPHEMNTLSGYSQDPLQEASAITTTGLLHKYQGRALMIAAGSCAINCRYCFRRHFPYHEHPISQQERSRILKYLKTASQLNEIILSGGEPLLRHDKDLHTWIAQFALIPHLTRIRIHTRLPVVIPERVTQTLIEALTHTRLTPVVVIHCNHPNEIDEALTIAMHRMQMHNIRLYNQTVLLKGVNDNADILAKLSERLFDLGVQPYYIHRLDKVQGTAHFDVDLDRAKSIQQSLQAKLPGYLVPKFVQEIPGEPNKTILSE